MWFLGPTRVVDANGISIALTIFAELTRWQTDWQTDRPRYSVGNNSWMHSGEATYFWSSRLNRSDQLQQSAVIFSVRLDVLQSVSHRRTRQVTVCVILFMLIFNVNMLNVNYLFKNKKCKVKIQRHLCDSNPRPVRYKNWRSRRIYTAN